jgi:hypothetical protein
MAEALVHEACCLAESCTQPVPEAGRIIGPALGMMNRLTATFCILAQLAGPAFNLWEML